MLNPRLCLGISLVMLLMNVECMEKQLTVALNNHVSIVTYAARGLQSESIYVQELLIYNDCDILCLQEHWLLNENLNISDCGRSEWNGFSNICLWSSFWFLCNFFPVNRSPH